MFEDDQIRAIKIEHTLARVTDERYRRLFGTVLERIPDHLWDNERVTISVELREEMPERVGGYAFTRPGEIVDTLESGQVWEITFFKKPLDGVSDVDVMFTLGHELGHIIANSLIDEHTYCQLRFQDPIIRNREKVRDEKAADAFAIGWGFPSDPHGPFSDS